jgi:hypothetical protein
MKVTPIGGIGVFLFAIGMYLLVRALHDTSDLAPLLGGFAGILLGFGLLLIFTEVAVSHGASSLYARGSASPPVGNRHSALI